MASASQPLRTRKRRRPAAPQGPVPGSRPDEPYFPPDPDEYALGTLPVRWPDDPPPDPDGNPYPDVWTGPMTPEHLEAMTDGYQMLKARYADCADVCVASELTMYYWEGGKKRWLQPDVFVTFGTRERKRRVWLVQEEGKLADFILEVASESTHVRDSREKRAIYERLGVAEYWQFDPHGDYLNPVLQGRRLNVAGAYEPLPLTATPDGLLCAASDVLALHICADGPRLRLFDPAAGRFLPTNQDKDDIIAEERQGRLEESRARLEESRARKAAEAEVEQLKRQLASR